MSEQESQYPWALKIPKPRGLHVQKRMRPQKFWDDPKVPEYFDRWYWLYKRVGRPEVCRAIDDSNVVTLKQAQEYAVLQVKALDAEKTAELQAALDGTRTRRTGCTLGAFLRAFEAVAKARGLKEWQRGRGAMRLVVAIANGIMPPLSNKRMDGEGGRMIREVEALPVESALCAHTVQEYARLMQGGDVLNLDKNLPPAINGVINSTLGNARVPLSEANRIMEMAALKVDWQKLETFMSLTLPTAPKDLGVEIPCAEGMAKMFAAWRILRASEAEHDQEMALCNELLRLLGLRSGELVMARESWIFTNPDKKCFLWVKNRAEEKFSCKSGNAAKLPLSAELAERLKARCAKARAAGIKNPFLLLPMVPGAEAAKPELLGEEQKERRELVRDTHNAWLKGFIGEVASGQGNHRLRKWCATRLYKLAMDDHGDHDKAAREVKEYLRHSKEATALLHYIARNDELLRTMTDDGELTN
jgi:integrase